MPTSASEAAVRRIANSVGPAVVRIGRHLGRGAGVVVSTDRVLTNAHNLRGQHTTVTFADGRAEQGEVRGVDSEGDLAVLEVPTGGLEGPAWATDTEVGLGSTVVTVTAPAGGGLRVSSGAVTAVDRAFRGPGSRAIVGGIEHCAPLAHGSSGGPLLDEEGRLVGVNTHRLDGGFYLAIPATGDLRTRVDALAGGTSVHRPRLGVALVPARAARRLRAVVGLEPRDGLLVRGVEPESPADAAGIRTGDLIVEADGRPVTAPEDLHAVLDTSPGSVTLLVVRADAERTVTVELGD